MLPHRWSTYGDAGFGPDHPVCGIDWYDAVGYARFTGKQLPMERVTLDVPVVTTIRFPIRGIPWTIRGMRGFIGNVWKMTRRCFVDGDELVAMFRGMDSSSIVGDWTVWIAIKGDAKTSVGEHLNP